MINELLEKRDILGDIAVELYGDFWITEETFWGSTTEQQMLEVTEQLNELGWVDPVSDEEIEMADKIMEMLIKEGKIKDSGK
jgi:predicted nucleic acid-binding protein